jgi:hypothetical protein
MHLAIRVHYLECKASEIICLDSSVSQMTTDKEQTTLYLDPELKKLLVQLAKEDRRSLTNFMEVLIIEALKTRGKL